jgi:serine/threonine protein kinase
MNQARINPADTGLTDMADMDAERQREIELLVKSALELNVYDRRAFLEKACAGDESLRREVESLLVAHERPVETIAGEQSELKSLQMPEVSTKERQHSATTLIDGEQNFKFAPGEILDGRYMIEHELGIGGIGQVFLAQNLKLPGRVRVVIKVLREQTLEREDRDWFEIKFRAEIEALSRIEHPGVVSALDAGQLPDGRMYFVMEYIPGKTLRSVMQPQGVEPKRAADLLRKIAQALDAAHEKAVIHRDLKPANIMLQTAGREEYIKIIDFGIATVLGTAAANLKQTKSIGTLPYMSPEQMYGRPIAASDIFALGVIAFEMVTGQLPFNADTTAQQIELQRAGVGEKLRELRLRLPEAAGAAILKAIDFEASNRFRTAREFSEAFDRALAESDTADPFHTTPVPPALPQPAELTQPPGPRRKWLAFIAGFIVTILVAVAVGTIAFFRLAPAPVIERTTANPAPSPTAAPERGLSYSLLALKNPARYPGGKLFTPLGDVNFKAGDQVKLNVSVPQPGYLYVINEGPERSTEPPDFVIMFPKAGDSAQVAANQTIQIPTPSEEPENDWFVFTTEEKGVEKIWLIWSEEGVAQLEEIKNLGNPKDIGLVRDPNQIKSVAQYLKELATTEAGVEKDETNGLTKLKGRGEVLAGVVRLKHQ